MLWGWNVGVGIVGLAVVGIVILGLASAPREAYAAIGGLGASLSVALTAYVRRRP